MATETKKTATPPNPPTWDKKEKEAIAEYGCELLIENANQEQLGKTNYPSDAMIVTYKLKDKVHFDLCRGSKVNIFDLYFDKFGKGSVQGIDFGRGNISPAMWGYKAPDKKKKRRS
tara:strand:+ start:704 stop:1051 length:348 start_codon:yes stop_codon:yes gene_type:complete